MKQVHLVMGADESDEKSKSKDGFDKRIKDFFSKK